MVGTASGMSAAAGLRYFYQDDDDYKAMAGGLHDKYAVHNMFDLYHDRRPTKGEHWALVLCSIKHLYDLEAGEPYYDLKELLEGKNYYIVTTNQDFQLSKIFPEDKTTRLQGIGDIFNAHADATMAWS